MATAEGEIVNKVKQSKKLVTVDLTDFYDDTPVYELDLKEFLHKGLMLKEDQFREGLENHDWPQYEDAYLTVYCSTDAIIAKWAYMLVAQHAMGFVKDLFQGRKEEIIFELFRRKLNKRDWSQYEDKFVLVKGCNDKEKPVPESAYMHVTKQLLPHVQKIMYGEACSNVPVYRKPRS